MITSSMFAGVIQTEHAEVELISEVKTISPAQPFWVALRIKHEPHWHTYWRNAGDSGLETRLTWTLPEGFSAGDIQWPIPEVISYSEITSYGYKGELFLLTKIFPPEQLVPGTIIQIKLKAAWLICKVECLPGEADLSISLPVDNKTILEKKWAKNFNDSRANLPIKGHGWETVLENKNDSSIIFSIKKPSWLNYNVKALHFFPYNAGYIKNTEKQKILNSKNGITLEIKLEDFVIDEPEILRGILVSESGWCGPNSEKAIEIEIPTTLSSIKESSNNTINGEQIVLALLFAFIGGIILNLMPCVLPVLSIKILGFVQQAGDNKQKILKNGLFFTLGVILSFLTLAGLLIILRAGGEQLGWGFQLQSPIFIIILSVLLFLFALNLLGVFEIGIPTSGFGGSNKEHSGISGSILSGVAATVLATPCTAPFMGSALGFAITQPVHITLLIFASLGLGMAAPYLLLSLFPQWLRYLPKPGSWMNTLKQFMGFLLLATIVWLVWILGIQTNTSTVTGLMLTLLITGFAGWIFGKWGSVINKSSIRKLAGIVSLSLVISAIFIAASFIDTNNRLEDESNLPSDNKINWQKYSQEKVTQLLSEGKPIFIDFTAAWCLTCQVNKKVALEAAEVINKFNDLNVAALKADWTTRDSTITKALAKYGRNSVPLYVYYNADNRTPVILPEILTPGILLNILK